LNTKGTTICSEFTAWRGKVWFNKGFKIDRVVKAVSLLFLTDVSYCSIAAETTE